ncbi:MULTISPECIES: hypothetical protein [unclassified Imperialibacter]|uniref:hypothetical protein n=1 Tax=unclassified Imperialibacter TaxID=2629706 RepID=UPI00186A21C6|nr:MULTISPECIES: hypothetical protein [unclassified Imperialibacter]
MKSFSVGGLTDVGFSLLYPEILLVVSAQGRGLIDCKKFILSDRDSEVDGNWLNYQELWSFGIGKVSQEKIKIAGLNGGGLSTLTENGDSLELMALDWPICDIVFQPNWNSIYQEKSSHDCFNIFRDSELRAYGFSSNGQFLAIATGADVIVYSRKDNY